jgi:ribosomal protein L37AE/L43A
MPYKNPEDKKAYNLRYNATHRQDRTEYFRYYNKNRNVKKRCPECRKQFTIRKDRESKHCPSCGVFVRVSKTLSANPNSDNAHGIRLKVV